MQKKIIALAIAGAISGLAAGSAFADNASIYGLLDYGMLDRSGGSGAANAASASQVAFNSGISAGSRIGFKGAEDIGGGYKAIFELEYGLNIDNNNGGSMGNGVNKVGTTTGTAPSYANVAAATAAKSTCFAPVGVVGTPGYVAGSATYDANSNNCINSTSTATNPQSAPLWNRHSYVGITGEAGTFVGGRLEGDRYSVSTKFDPFSGGTVGNFGSLIGNQARADNAIAYISPSVNGFVVLAAYSNNLTGNEAGGNVGDARLWAIRPEYSMGPLDVLVNFEDATVHGTGGDIKIFDIAGSYDLGVVKLMGMFDHINTGGVLDTGAIRLDQKSYLIGATAPVAGFNLKFSYADVKDGDFASNDCKKTSIGADYAVSKRTSFYADFASINNDAKATCSIATSAAAYSGANSAFKAGLTDSSLNQTGFATHGFDIGMKHTF
jgi:predicted porin